jgi:hypothetical protein
MTQTFKILHGIGSIDESRFFTRIGERNSARTRLAAGVKNLEGRRARTEIRRHCFSSRVVGGGQGQRSEDIAFPHELWEAGIAYRMK